MTSHSSLLSELRVSDVATSGIIACSPDAPLHEAAATMAQRRIHSVIVVGVLATRAGERLSWGVITDLDVTRGALGSGLDGRVGDIARTEAPAVDGDDTLRKAAETMVEHGVSHLVVLRGERPVGVLSSLDVAAALIAGEKR
jgi:CBS domain-containing protein